MLATSAESSPRAYREKVFHAKQLVRAVDDVSLDLVAGQVTAIVGESGSGKSVLARMLARIITPTSGELSLDGLALRVGAKRTLDYASSVQLVLQDPFASTNPVHRIRHSLERPLLIHGATKDDVENLAKAALSRVSHRAARAVPSIGTRTNSPAPTPTCFDRASPVREARRAPRRRAHLHAGRVGASGHLESLKGTL